MSNQQIEFLKFIKSMLLTKSFFSVKDMLQEKNFTLKKNKREFIEIYEIRHNTSIITYKLIRDLNNWFIMYNDEPYKI